MVIFLRKISSLSFSNKNSAVTCLIINFVFLNYREFEMTSNEIRQSFLSFFEGKQHRIVPSAPVIPHGDPTLLFTNAGMNQFKDVFLGSGKRDYTRATDTQKCIRVSGKHNDLEEVGVDTYHHTFFEMLGNWSFGDYYKEEAIEWAWELLTEVWKLPKDRLFATVFRTDDEAFELWKNYLPEERILRFDEKDNFWEMGDTGPCGPCSEIHFDRTPDKSGASLVNADSPDVIEIWNLVFIQYNRKPDGHLEELSAKHVDTGMGFERICAVIQDKNSNYDTDVFQPVIEKIEELSSKKYSGDLDNKDGIAMRVIADHVRTVSFAIADGALPGNEGRGYVLRRILRRGLRFARNLGFTEPVIYKLLPTLAGNMGGQFPELRQNLQTIEKVIKGEEESFLQTLERGLEKFEEITQPFITRFNEEEKKIVALDSKARELLLNEAKSLDKYMVLIYNRTATIYGLERVDAIETIQKLAYENLSRIDEKQLAIQRDRNRTFYGTLNELISTIDEIPQLDIETALNKIFKNILNNIRFEQGDEAAKDYVNETISEVNERLDKAFAPVIEERNTIHSALHGIGESIPGEDAFLIYDSFGFPLDLTELLARELGLKVDIYKFNEKMKEQRERSRKARKIASQQLELPEFEGKSTFTGYDSFEEEAKVLFTNDNQVVLDKTPFYVESGGQVSDTGSITIAGESYDVTDVRKSGDAIVHICDREVEPLFGASALAKIDGKRRRAIMRNHSVTHLFHEALRQVLGNHVQQQGSLVAPDYMRFDFNHFEKVSAGEIRQIEEIVNNKILESVPVQTQILNMEEARKNPKIKMFFGDKYGDVVRTVIMDDQYSIELCGGTHVSNTSEIGLFKITSESSIAAGIRRVEAITGEGIEKFIHTLESKLEEQKRDSSKLQEKIKQLEKELSEHKLSQASNILTDLVKQAVKFDGIRIVTGKVDAENMDALRNLAENLRNELGNSGIGLLAIHDGEKVQLACISTDDIKDKYPAGMLVGAAAKTLGGGGGGKPHLATAGGRNIEALEPLLKDGFLKIVKGMRR